MSLLARREHAAAELRRKLEQRGFEAKAVAAVAADLEAENLLSDARYAEEAVRSGVNHGRGPVRLLMEMERRGVAAELAVRALEQADVDWYRLAADVRRGRFGPAMPEAFQARARQARFLRYRGFTADQVAAALKEDII